MEPTLGERLKVQHKEVPQMKARGYFVASVGIDEEVPREYIRRQEDEDRRVDQPRLLDD